MTPPPHDFSRPSWLPPDLKARLVPLMNRVASLLTESLAAMSVRTEIRLADCVTAWPLESLAAWTGKPVAYRVAMGQGRVNTLLAFPNSLAQALAGWLLGDVPTRVPEERDLSPGELSLCELLVETMVNSLGEAWLDDEPLTFQLLDRERNLRRSRVFKPTESLVACQWTVKGLFGEDGWSWLVPYEALRQLLGSAAAPAVILPDSGTRQQIETLIRDMATQLAVRLGSVQLTAPQLAELRVGDVVVLDQRVTDPLKAFVSGEASYLGWPGTVGNRQAFQIESEMNHRRRLARTPRGDGNAPGSVR